MRVIVTGGSGLIGTVLVRQLLDNGHEVIVLSRNPDKTRPSLPTSIQLEKWDAKTGESWSHHINADTAIVNLAGENPANWRWTDAHKRRVLESRITTSQAVVEAIQLASQPPRVLLQASAVGYYGDRGDTIITEDTPPASGFRADVCVEWEQVTASLNVRTVYLRIGIVLDKRGGALPPLRLASYLMGRRLGDGKQWIPWIHNEDVAGAIRFLMHDQNAMGAFNLSAPNPATNREMMQTLSRITHVPALIPVPAFALKLALGEMSETVLDSQRVIPQKLNDAGYTFMFPELEATLRSALS